MDRSSSGSTVILKSSRRPRLTRAQRLLAPLRRRPVRVLLLLAAVGLLLRLGVVADRVEAERPLETRLVGEEPGYDYLASRVARGESLNWPARMPLYPLYAGVIYAATESKIAAVLWSQAVLGAATVFLLFWIVRRRVGEWIAAGGSGLVALHPRLIEGCAYLDSLTLFVPLLLLVLLSLDRLLSASRPRLSLAVLFGLAVALATYCRPAPVLIPAMLAIGGVMVGWDWRRTFSFTLASLLVVGVALVPWTIHNWRTYGVVRPLATSGGVVWQASPEYHDLERQGRSLLSIWNQELSPQRNGGHDPFSWEGDRHFTERAVASVTERPATYAWYSVKKSVRLWMGHPDIDWKPLRTEDAWSTFLGITVLLFGPLGLLSAVVCWRAGWSRELLLPYALLLVYFTVVHALLWAEIRLALPLHALLAVLVAGAGMHLRAGWFGDHRDRRRRRRKKSSRVPLLPHSGGRSRRHTASRRSHG